MVKKKHPEDDLQRACVAWFKMQYPRVMIHHSPNGGKRDAITAAIFKAMGTKAGFPDLIIMYAGRVLFIEMKAPGGTQTETQKEFQNYCELNNFPYRVCYNFNDFMEIVRLFFIY